MNATRMCDVQSRYELVLPSTADIWEFAAKREWGCLGGSVLPVLKAMLPQSKAGFNRTVPEQALANK
jgi:hypothetical protein